MGLWLVQAQSIVNRSYDRRHRIGGIHQYMGHVMDAACGWCSGLLQVVPRQWPGPHCGDSVRRSTVSAARRDRGRLLLELLLRDGAEPDPVSADHSDEVRDAPNPFLHCLGWNDRGDCHLCRGDLDSGVGP